MTVSLAFSFQTVDGEAVFRETLHAQIVDLFGDRGELATLLKMLEATLESHAVNTMERVDTMSPTVGFPHGWVASGTTASAEAELVAGTMRQNVRLNLLPELEQPTSSLISRRTFNKMMIGLPLGLLWGSTSTEGPLDVNNLRIVSSGKAQPMQAHPSIEESSHESGGWVEPATIESPTATASGTLPFRALMNINQEDAVGIARVLDAGPSPTLQAIMERRRLREQAS